MKLSPGRSTTRSRSLRRRTVLAFGVGVVAGCGGRSDSPPAAGTVVYVAQPAADTLIFEITASSKTTTATIWESTGSLRVTSAQVREGSSGGDIYLDPEGRPSMIVDAVSRARTQFLYPTPTSMVIVQQDVAGAVQEIQVCWREGGRFFRGTATKLDPVIPADLTAISEITETVNSKLSDLRAVRISSAGRRFIDLLPMGAAHAQQSEADIRQIAVRYLSILVAAAFPALIVALFTVPFFPPLVAAIATLVTFVAAIASIASAKVDQTKTRELIEAWVTRPFSGNAALQGSISIPAGDIEGSPCSGSLSVVGSVLMSIGTGTGGSATITGTEYITTPCFSQVFAKGVNAATLTRSGNTLTGQSGSPSNPFVFNLTVDPSLTFATGTVSYPYSFNGLTGFASADVTLRR